MRILDINSKKSSNAMDSKIESIPLKVKWYGDYPIRYRPDTSDEAIVREVLDRRIYRRPKIGFDIDKGERWLDLGANIGTFGLYCITRGATVDCYEPSKSCYDLLEKNISCYPDCNCYNSAVTHVSSATQPFVTFHQRGRRARFSPKNGSFHKGSLLDDGKQNNGKTYKVKNTFILDIIKSGVKYDGVKMDIEGSEFGILDLRLIPDCNKLVFEYHCHTWDRSSENLNKRLHYLKGVFKIVNYQGDIDECIKKGGVINNFMDRMIWCMGRR